MPSRWQGHSSGRWGCSWLLSPECFCDPPRGVPGPDGCIYQAQRPVGRVLGLHPTLSQRLSPATWAVWLRRCLRRFLRQRMAGSSLLMAFQETPSVCYVVLASRLPTSLCSSRKSGPARQPLPPAEDLPLGAGCVPIPPPPQVGSPLPGPEE